MRVKYGGRLSHTASLPRGQDGFITLYGNDWDDYGYRTTFRVSASIHGQQYSMESIRLLIDGAKYTADALDDLLTKGWSGEFPIQQLNYISVPSEITFYERLQSMVGPQALIHVARLLRDASYLIRIEGDESAQALTLVSGFDSSLQRERGSVKAFMDGWRVFQHQPMAVEDLIFWFTDVSGNRRALNAKFESSSALPHDINVLIGPNGAGKSQLLHQIVRHWIDPEKDEAIGFSAKPNVGQLVVVSYSPFEEFPVDLSATSLQDKGVYKYFGFRGRADKQEQGMTMLSHDIPRSKAVRALISCIADDRRFHAIRDWSLKLETMHRVLQTAFEFDFAALELPSKEAVAKVTTTSAFAQRPIEFQDGERLRLFVRIDPLYSSALDLAQLDELTIEQSGVVFFRDGQIVRLSSGQQLFAYVVVNILGAIRRNSLLLIDEPELFLHPTLEIQFVEMLKAILASFTSKAIIATHSVVTVREVPSDCVHVLYQTPEGVVVKHPPFQTFGGDFQRISSYVFGDRAVSKPFETWISQQLDEKGSAEAVIASLGADVSEELIVQIQAMGRHKS